MSTLKYSRQREAIKNYLLSTKEHPTADIVYAKIREEFPNISLGTVYRNLALLVELGEAIKVPSMDGCDHFDGDVSNHYHVICKECGGISDLSQADVGDINGVKERANTGYNGLIEGCLIHFYGICNKCSKIS